MMGTAVYFSDWLPISQSDHGPLNTVPKSPQAGNNVASQWELAVADINALLHDHETGNTQEQYSGGITRTHWQPNSSGSKCSNPRCQKSFSFMVRHHHCRRCGYLFCSDCTNYLRRLNELAHPDPNGKQQKVCQKCFDQGPQTIGQICSLTSHFQFYKQNKHKIGHQTAALGGHRGVSITDFRERFNIEDACERLKLGFSSTVDKSGMGRVLEDLKGLVSKPEWHRSAYWALGNLSSKCYSCEKEFSILRTKKDCCMCGSAICMECSSKDLLVYLPDDIEDSIDLTKQTQLAIIRIIGCPEKEPNISIYLRVCHQCCEKLTERQVSAYRQDTASLDSHDSILQDQDVFWSELDKVSRELRDVQYHIEKQLPKYQELIDALEISSGSPQSLPHARSNMQTLAKAQSDLSDYTTKQVLVIHSLKKLKPTSKGQMAVIRNMIRAQCEYYQDTAFQFRQLKRKLETVTPVEVLSSIQAIVDKNAINSCYLSIKQLAFEVLHLCCKHKLSQVLVKRLVCAEEIVQKDLQSTLSKSEEEWEHHQMCVMELLQMQLKDHRLIKPSRRLTKSYGNKHIKHIIFERCDIVLRQVYLQLNATCVDMNFKRSKEILTKLRQDLPELTFQLLDIPEDDWELIEDTA